MSDESYARYCDEATLTIRQFVNESDRQDLPDLATEDLAIAACDWVLKQDDRWGRSHVRLRCIAMALRIESLMSCELIPEAVGQIRLRALKEVRPRHIGKSDQVSPSRRQQTTRNRTIVKNKGLRKVTKVFSDSNDDLDKWIAGLLRIISRIGWRPGEILSLLLIGRILSAPAEKYRRTVDRNGDGTDQENDLSTADRGLFERLEISIGERYPDHILAALCQWIEGTPHWCTVYGGEAPLLAAVRERIRRACSGVGVKAFSLYDLRHFAIANMKKSKRPPEEIAAVVNHLNDRTAGEHYGKARSGFRRPKAMFSAAPERIAEVRRSARRFPKHKFGRRRKRQNPKS